MREEEHLKTMKEIKEDAIIERVAYFNGNRTHAAKSLDIAARSIREYIARIRKERPDVVIPEMPKQLIAQQNSLRSKDSWVKWRARNKEASAEQEKISQDNF